MISIRRWSRPAENRGHTECDEKQPRSDEKSQLDNSLLTNIAPSLLRSIIAIHYNQISTYGSFFLFRRWPSVQIFFFKLEAFDWKKMHPDNKPDVWSELPYYGKYYPLSRHFLNIESLSLQPNLFNPAHIGPGSCETTENHEQQYSTPHKTYWHVPHIYWCVLKGKESLIGNKTIIIIPNKIFCFMRQV